MIGTARTRRRAVSVAFALAVTGLLVAVVLDRRDEFSAALGSAPLWVLLVAVVLQLVATVARSDAWFVCVRAAGGTIDRRPLFRAAGLGYLASPFNAQLGTAARIAALRRVDPAGTPGVPALVASEVPIVVAEGAFGALASFTLVGPLGLPWWAPVAGFVLAAVVAVVLRRLTRGHDTGWRTGLAVLRTLQGRTRTLVLVSVAITAQVLRNWLCLEAVGVEASVFDATAVLIAMSTLAQLPIGPGSAAAAVVLILGAGGVGAAAAAGVLLTATGVAGALVYVLWAGCDGAVAKARAARGTLGAQGRAQPAPVNPW